MKKRKNMLKLIAWMLVVVMLGSSLAAPAGASAARKLRLNKKKVTIKVGRKVKLKVKNKKKKMSVKWSSSNKKVATVSKTGLVKGKKKGTARITAKVGKKKLICRVRVKAKSNGDSGGEEVTPPAPAVPEQPPVATTQPSQAPASPAPPAGTSGGTQGTGSPSDHTAAPTMIVTPIPTAGTGQDTPVPSDAGDVTATPGSSGDAQMTPDASAGTEVPGQTPGQGVGTTPGADITEIPPTSAVVTPVPVPTYEVTVSLKKDAADWTDSGKKIYLKESGSDEFISALSEGNGKYHFAVENGTYEVYEGDTDTEISVAVKDSAASAAVEFFTVYFVDGETGINMKVPGQMTVLRGSRIDTPTANDFKQGKRLDQWMTAASGGVVFDFAHSSITETTRIYATWVADTTVTSYTMEYYLQNVSGTGYSLGERETNIQGNINQPVKDPKVIEGYQYDYSDPDITAGLITPGADGKTVVKCYYSRKSYTLTWSAGDGDFSDGSKQKVETKKFGESINVPTDLSRKGYSLEGWNPEPAASMPARDVAYTARWNAKTDTPYKVQYHLQKADADNNYEIETETFYGTTDTTITVSAKTYTGFELDEAKSSKSQQVAIRADGEAAIHFYYNRKTYTLTWNPNGGSMPANGYTAGAVKFGAVITPPDQAQMVRTGYVFTGWDPQPASVMPAANVAYTAQWKQLATPTPTKEPTPTPTKEPTPTPTKEPTPTPTKGPTPAPTKEPTPTPTKEPTPTPTKGPTPAPTKEPTPTPTKEPTPTPAVPGGYQVTLSLKLDNAAWAATDASAKNMSFSLYNASSKAADFQVVNGVYQATAGNGTYRIYAGDADTGKEVQVSGQAVTTQDIKYWTVSLYDDDTSERLGQRYALDGATMAKPFVEKTGYYVDRWLRAQGGNLYDFNNSKVTGPVSLYAKFEQCDYFIGFDFGGTIDTEAFQAQMAEKGLEYVEDVDKYYYGYETEIVTLPYPQRAGYSFVGWTGSNGNTPEADVEMQKDGVAEEDGSTYYYYKANWKSNITCTAQPIHPTKDILTVNNKKAALNMPVNQLATSEWSGDFVREGVTPQGYTSYIYYDKDYKDYYVVYLSDNRVVGMATMSRNFTYQYTESQSLSFGSTVPADGFKSMSAFDYAGGRYYDAGDAYVMVYTDQVSADKGKIYAIQVFAKSVTMGGTVKTYEKLDDLIKVENLASQGGDVCKSMADELMDWANAYRVTAGKTKFGTWKSGQNTAQQACDELADGAVKPSGSSGLIDKYEATYGAMPVWMAQIDGSRSPDAFGFMTWWLDDSSTQTSLYAALTKTPAINEYYASAGYAYIDNMTYAVLHFVHP